MDNLRILVVELDKLRADRLVTQLSSADHLAIPLDNLEEAAEALSIQNFDAVLLGSPQPAAALAQFADTLRERDAGGRSGARAVILSLAESPESVTAIDCVLPESFDPAMLSATLSRFSQRCPCEASTAGAPAAKLVDFEPAGFEEQCAHEPELMVEIIDLFFTECEHEVPGMRQALAQDDLEQLSRIAHTLKGSLGTLNAHLAREYAHGLELAAKEQNRARCTEDLDSLDTALRRLKEPLIAFRRACAQR